MFFLFVTFCFSAISLLFLLLKKNKVKLAPAIPIGASTTLTEGIIQTPLIVAVRTIKIVSMQSKAALYLFNF